MRLDSCRRPLVLSMPVRPATCQPFKGHMMASHR